MNQTRIRQAASRGRTLVISGAGISAESGIPTFRGEEGYWTIGSVNYRPEELGTLRKFQEVPWDIWRWYLHRRQICEKALPNPAHHKLVEWESQWRERFHLVTQNVDGLHRQAGQMNLYESHGNLQMMRCSQQCLPSTWPIPSLAQVGCDDLELKTLLACPNCGAAARPHLLWFDESYNEEHYRWNSAQNIARKAGLVVTIGTSGVATLPSRLSALAKSCGAVLVDINPEQNPLSRQAQASGGAHLACGACEGLERLEQILQG